MVNLPVHSATDYCNTLTNGVDGRTWVLGREFEAHHPPYVTRFLKVIKKKLNFPISNLKIQILSPQVHIKKQTTGFCTSTRIITALGLNSPPFKGRRVL